MTSQLAGVDASPTKEFFVEMLTKDVQLTDAVLDLIDNSIDGARRVKTAQDFGGFLIDLNIDVERFRITDNCGGIPLDVARDYAFRFGRPPDASSVPGSIGRFGVGMKRAVFKLGSHFIVTSRSEESEFSLEVDVPTWLKDQGPWHFPFSRLVEYEEPLDSASQGTVVEVDVLHKSVSEEFDLEDFFISLRDTIQRTHQSHLNAGLVITVNGILLRPETAQLLRSTNLVPAVRTLRYHGRRVRVRVIAGVGESDPSDAGWSVYCNGRMVVDADQSGLTGWGQVGIERIPKYHNQFARFRGHVYFESSDPSDLPWNTAKNSLDVDSGLYRAVRQEMVAAMRPVIDFLNDLDSELDSIPEGAREYENYVKAAQPVDAVSVRGQRVFTFTRQPRQPRSTVAVQYQKSRKQVAKVRRALGVSSASAAGSKTFDYYYDLECEDDDE